MGTLQKTSANSERETFVKVFPQRGYIEIRKFILHSLQGAFDDNFIPDEWQKLCKLVPYSRFKYLEWFSGASVFPIRPRNERCAVQIEKYWRITNFPTYKLDYETKNNRLFSRLNAGDSGTRNFDKNYESSGSIAPWLNSKSLAPMYDIMFFEVELLWCPKNWGKYFL